MAGAKYRALARSIRVAGRSGWDTFGLPGNRLARAAQCHPDHVQVVARDQSAPSNNGSDVIAKLPVVEKLTDVSGVGSQLPGSFRDRQYIWHVAPPSDGHHNDDLLPSWGCGWAGCHKEFPDVQNPEEADVLDFQWFRNKPDGNSDAKEFPDAIRN
jgi:hypothetical protein